MAKLITSIFLFLIIFIYPQYIHSKFLNNLYHNTNEIFDNLDKLAAGQCFDILTSLEFSIDEDSKIDKLKYYKVSNHKNTLKSNLSKPKRNLSKIFIIFGEHSRELITSELAYYFIQVLCKKVSDYDSETVEKILSSAEFYIVPIVNVFGRKKVEEGDWCWRVNERKVDINRNWDINWESNNSGSAEDTGSCPFSEWETKYLNLLLSSIAPDAFITTHSGSLGMYTPYAYKMVDLLEPEYNQLNKMIKMLESINEENCLCDYGAMGNIFSYQCSGTCLDYAYEKLNIKYDFAFEIYNGNSSVDKYTERILNNQNLKAFSCCKNLENTNITSKLSKSSNLDETKLAENKNINEKNEKEKNLVLNEVNKKFSLMKSKIKGNMQCMIQMNPLNELNYRNTLINWTNIYLRLSILISEDINNHSIKLRAMAKERRNAGLRLKNDNRGSLLSNLQNFRNIRAFYSNMMEDFKNTSLFRQIMSYYLFLLIIFICVLVYVKFYNVNQILSTQTNVNYYKSVVINLLDMEKETKLQLDIINNNDYTALKYSHLYFMKIYSRELLSHNIANIQFDNNTQPETQTAFNTTSLGSINNTFSDLGTVANNLNFSLLLNATQILDVPSSTNEDVLDPDYLIPILYTFIPVFYQNLNMNGVQLLNFYFMGYKYQNNQCDQDSSKNIYFKYPIETQEITDTILNSNIYDSTLDPVGLCYLPQVRTTDMTRVQSTNWYLNYEEDYINDPARTSDSRLIRLLKLGIGSYTSIYFTNYVSFKLQSSLGETYVFTFSQKIDKIASVLPFISYDSYGDAQNDFFSMVNFPNPPGENYTYDYVAINIKDGVYYNGYNIDDNSTIIMNTPNFINNYYDHTMLPLELINNAGSGITAGTLFLTYSEMSRIDTNYSQNYYFELDSLVFDLITFLNNFLQYTNYESRMISSYNKNNNVTDNLKFQDYVNALNTNTFHRCSISNLSTWYNALDNNQDFSYDCSKDYCFFNNCTTLNSQSSFIPNCYCLPFYCYDPFTITESIPNNFLTYYQNNQAFYENANNYYDKVNNNNIICQMNFYQKDKNNSPTNYKTKISLTDAEFKANTTIFMMYLMEENLMNDQIITRFANDTSLVMLIVFIIFISVIFIYFIVFCKCMQNKIEMLTDRIEKVAVIIKIIFKISDDNEDNYDEQIFAGDGTIVSDNQDFEEERLQDKIEKDFLVNLNSLEDPKEKFEDESKENRLGQIINLNVNLEKEFKQLGIILTDNSDDSATVKEPSKFTERYSDELQQFINIIIDNIKEFKIEFNANGNMYEGENILNREYIELVTSKYYLDKILGTDAYKKNESFEKSGELFDLEDAKDKSKLSLNLIYELISTEEMNDMSKFMSNFYFKEPMEYSILNFYKWIDTLLYDDNDYINEVTDSEKLKTAINFYVHEVHMQWKSILDEKIKNQEI